MDRSVGSPWTWSVLGFRGPGVSVFGLPCWSRSECEKCVNYNSLSLGIEASVTWIEERFFLRRASRTLNVLTLLRRATRTSRTSSVIGFAAGYFLRCVSMSGSRTRFSKCSVSGSPYFVDVELIQIE